MGKPGRDVVAKHLPSLKHSRELDIVVAQSENVSHGKSIIPRHVEELRSYGVDFFTGGNHSFSRPHAISMIRDPKQPLVAPINMITDVNHPGAKTLSTSKGDVLIISVLGSVFPEVQHDNPLKSIDIALNENKDEQYAAIIVNIHADYSSEKVMMGHYLDGRVTMVVGDHWHVPTADARILPKGTAYMTDVGMCGTLNSSLGISYSSTIPRWRDEVKTKQTIELNGPTQFSGLLFDTDTNEIDHIYITDDD